MIRCVGKIISMAKSILDIKIIGVVLSGTEREFNISNSSTKVLRPYTLENVVCAMQCGAKIHNLELTSRGSLEVKEGWSCYPNYVSNGNKVLLEELKVASQDTRGNYEIKSCIHEGCVCNIKQLYYISNIFTLSGYTVVKLNNRYILRGKTGCSVKDIPIVKYYVQNVIKVNKCGSIVAQLVNTNTLRMYIKNGIKGVNITDITAEFRKECKSKNIEMCKGIVGIGEKVFNSCQMDKLKLPAGLKVIGSEAFRGCNQLRYIEFGCELEEIGNRAFSECQNLRKVKLTSVKIMDIGEEIFSECVQLEDVEISNLNKIGKRMFEQCVQLKKVHIMCTLNEECESINVGSYAFDKCQSLKDISIMVGVKRIGVCAFRGCIKLKRYNFSNKLESIDDHAFDSSGIEVVKMNECKDLYNIKNRVFSNCKNLSSVILGDGLEYISDTAFKGCNELSIRYSGDLDGVPWGAKSVILNGKEKITSESIQHEAADDDSTVANIRNLKKEYGKIIHTYNLNKDGSVRGILYKDGYLLCVGSGIIESVNSNLNSIRCYNKVNYDVESMINEIELEEGITGLGLNAFLGLKELTDVTYESQEFSIIGKRAFKDCIKLECGDIFEGLDEVGDEAFANCINIKSVEIVIGDCDISNTAYMGCKNLVVMDIDDVDEYKDYIYDGDFNYFGAPNILEQNWDETDNRREDDEIYWGEW